MKIEIELSELEQLRSELIEAKISQQTAWEKYNALNEKNLIAQARTLAETLFEKYIEKTFKSLGFRDDGIGRRGTVNFRLDGLDWDNRNTWFDSKDVEINVHADVSKEMSRAFLIIGVVPPALRDSKVKSLEDYFNELKDHK